MLASSMPFTSVISSPRGRYELTLVDNDDNNTISLPEVELLGDVSIKYGDLQRQPVRQILKSYCTLNFADPRLNLHSLVRGSFDLERYEVRISGPNVEWRGAIKEEVRKVPLTNRIEKEVTQLRCFGGIDEGRFDTRNFKRRGPNDDIPDRSYNVFEMTPFLRYGQGCSERLRSDIELYRASDGSWHRVCESSDFGGPTQPINLYQNSDPYKAVKEWAKITKGVLYRSLSENSIIYDSTRLVGVDSNTEPVVGRNNNETDVESKSRSSFENRLVRDNLIIDGESGLRDLQKSGKQIVNIGSDFNILKRGAYETSTNQDVYNNTAWELSKTEDGSRPDVLYAGTDKGKKLDAFVGTDGNNDKLRIKLGEINPTEELGVLVTWDKNSNINSGNPTVRIKYRGSTQASTSNIGNDGILDGPLESSSFSPVIEIEGSNVVFRFKVRYYDSNGKVIETIKVQEDKQGTDVIEYDPPPEPLVVVHNVDTVEEAQKIRYGSKAENVQTWIFKAEMEKLSRPFGTKTLRAKVKDIYGPEWLHEMEHETGNKYYVATGLECNLSKGITDLSLVEVPEHINNFRQ